MPLPPVALTTPPASVVTATLPLPAAPLVSCTFMAAPLLAVTFCAVAEMLFVPLLVAEIPALPITVPSAFIFMAPLFFTVAVMPTVEPVIFEVAPCPIVILPAALLVVAESPAPTVEVRLPLMPLAVGVVVEMPPKSLLSVSALPLLGALMVVAVIAEVASTAALIVGVAAPPMMATPLVPSLVSPFWYVTDSKLVNDSVTSGTGPSHTTSAASTQLAQTSAGASIFTPATATNPMVARNASRLA